MIDFTQLDLFYQPTEPPAPPQAPLTPEASVTRPAPAAHLCQHVGGVRVETGGWTLEQTGEYAGRWVHGLDSCRKPAYDNPTTT